MARPDAALTPIERARLAEKGRLLYRKSCGACRQENLRRRVLLVYHLDRGEIEVARDLLAFLENEAEALRADDPAGQLTFTEALAARIRSYLDAK